MQQESITRDYGYGDDGINLGEIEGPQGDPKNPSYNPLHLFGHEVEYELEKSTNELSTTPKAKEISDFYRKALKLITTIRTAFFPVAQRLGEIGQQIGII